MHLVRVLIDAFELPQLAGEATFFSDSQLHGTVKARFLTTWTGFWYPRRLAAWKAMPPLMTYPQC